MAIEALDQGFNHLHKMSKEDPLVIVSLQTKMGHCMKASGRVDEAVSYFERAKGIVE